MDLHLAHVREELGRLGNHRGVHVDDSALAKTHQPRRFVQEDAAARAPPTRVGVGKEMADVRLAQGAENGVADRVHQYVGIRMSFQTFRVRNLHPAQEEFASLDQGVHVVTDANMNHARNYRARRAPDQQ